MNFRNIIIIFHSKLFYSAFTEHLLDILRWGIFVEGHKCVQSIHSFTQKISAEHLEQKVQHVPNIMEHNGNSKIILLGIDCVFEYSIIFILKIQYTI